jgi:hypothetical protein
MSVTSSRTIQVQYSGDITTGVITSALDNTVSPGMEIITSLTTGANTITAPVVVAIVVTGLLIIPPAGNTSLITLKGVTGDSGIPLHLSDPTSLAVDTTFTSLCLTAAAPITGLRLVWS